jgi:hypothetical protein
MAIVTFLMQINNRDGKNKRSDYQIGFSFFCRYQETRITKMQAIVDCLLKNLFFEPQNVKNARDDSTKCQKYMAKSFFPKPKQK